MTDPCDAADEAMNAISITFIVCTFNRAGAVLHALDAIADAAQPYRGRVDLVVVDNGSTDGTGAVVSAWAAAAPLPVKLIREPTPGLAAARNAGADAASGALLAFTDDDCVLAPFYIDDLLRHYRADAAPVIRGGRVELGDPDDLPFTIKTSDRPARMARDVHPCTLILGCNMVIPRRAMEMIGRFDERFGAGARFHAAEEADYVYRAYVQGIPVEYVPDMVVRHFHGRRHRNDIARLSAGYFLGNGALYAKHSRNGGLIRQLRWDVRKALGEAFGGQRLDPRLGLSHRAMLFGTLRGMAMYWLGTKRYL